MTKTKFTLPQSHKPYTDKYFLRSKEILEKDNLNPWIKMQVFVRKGPGIIAGIEEAVAVIEHYSNLKAQGGKIWALREGSIYQPKETVMLIEGPLQDFIELETMYLGVISAATTLANEGKEPDLKEIENRTREIVDLIKPRPVLYFGARHWHYSKDAEISFATFKGGAAGCSTDIGAETVGKKGLGTIPHALVLAYGSTVAAAKAFDKYIDQNVNRTVLVDTFNKEITDSLESAKALEDRLWGVRLDTCGENIGESCSTFNEKQFWTGQGVTVELAKRTRGALDKARYNKVKILLSSGFGNPEKVKAFLEAEEHYDIKLFDSLGIGGFFDARFATADIVEKDGKPFAKTGRKYNLNPRLVEV